MKRHPRPHPTNWSRRRKPLSPEILLLYSQILSLLTIVIVTAGESLRTEASFSYRGFPGGSDGKESACNVGDPGSIPRLGGCPGEENHNPLQCSFLKNPMDRGAWQATIHSHKRVRHDLTTKTTKGRGVSYFCTVEDQQRAL